MNNDEYQKRVNKAEKYVESLVNNSFLVEYEKGEKAKLMKDCDKYVSFILKGSVRECCVVGGRYFVKEVINSGEWYFPNEESFSSYLEALEDSVIIRVSRDNYSLSAVK